MEMVFRLSWRLVVPHRLDASCLGYFQVFLQENTHRKIHQVAHVVRFTLQSTSQR